MTRTLAAGLISAAVIAVAGCSRAGDPGTSTIAVIPKGTSHAFWQSIHAGAEKAAQELKVTVIWRGPLREDERSAQITEVEGFVTRGVSGIALAPLDDTALAPPVAEAVRRKIPVVIFDSALKGSGHVSFVATDNHQGGRLAGEGLAGLLPKGGNIVLLRYAEGSASTTERETGFLEAIGAHANLKVVSANQYGGADIEGAYKKSEAILSRFKTPGGGTRYRRDLLPERVHVPGDAASAPGQRLGRQGEVHRLRCVGHSQQSPRRRPHRRSGAPGSGRRWVTLR